MGKAKTLTAQELRRVQDYIASRSHSAPTLPVLKKRPSPDEPPAPQETVVEQMDGRDACEKTKALSCQQGDST